MEILQLSPSRLGLSCRIYMVNLYIYSNEISDNLTIVELPQISSVFRKERKIFHFNYRNIYSRRKSNLQPNQINGRYVVRTESISS